MSVGSSGTARSPSRAVPELVKILRDAFHESTCMEYDGICSPDLDRDAAERMARMIVADDRLERELARVIERHPTFHPDSGTWGSTWAGLPARLAGFAVAELGRSLDGQA